MQLTYYDEELNFGDALNKLIFEHYIPELLDDNEEEILLGIGTVLGLIKGNEKTKKIVVFSSGLGYGDNPEPDPRYDFICLRGPLTAQKLGLDANLAITDGAILLKGLHFGQPAKQYRWSYIPHRGSEVLFENWKGIVEQAGGHYISPINEPQFVIDEILKSEFIVAEAMHGAIVSDVLRVPWIAVSAYKHINSFKWTDWLMTMDMEYKPVVFPPVFHERKISQNMQDKIKVGISNPVNKLLSLSYLFYQKQFREKKILEILKKIDKQKTYLSADIILEKRFSQLKEKIDYLKTKYKKNSP